MKVRSTQAAAAVGGNTKLAEKFGLVTEGDYAALRCLTIPAVRNERSLGKGPKFVKLGKRVMYYHASIRDYIAAHTVTPQRPPLLTGRRKPRRPK